MDVGLYGAEKTCERVHLRITGWGECINTLPVAPRLNTWKQSEHTLFPEHSERFHAIQS